LSDFLHSPPAAGNAGAEALFPMVGLDFLTFGWWLAAVIWSRK